MTPEEQFLQGIERVFGFKVSQNTMRNITSLLGEYKEKVSKVVETKLVTMAVDKKFTPTDIRNIDQVDAIIRQAEEGIKAVTGCQTALMPVPRYLLAFTTLENVIDICCEATKIPRERLLSGKRNPEIVLCRNLICYFAGLYTGTHDQAIGDAIGRDRTSCITARVRLLKKIKNKDPLVLASVNEIEKLIHKKIQEPFS